MAVVKATNDVQQIESELRALSDRWERNKRQHENCCRKFRAKKRFLEKRSATLVATRHRLTLLAVLEQPDAVRIRFPYPRSNPCHCLNERAGTLLEIRRKTCRASFDGKTWTFPIDRLIPVDQQEFQWLLFNPSMAKASSGDVSKIGRGA